LQRVARQKKELQKSCKRVAFEKKKSCKRVAFEKKKSCKIDVCDIKNFQLNIMRKRLAKKD
jgi:hypothetical protein